MGVHRRQAVELGCRHAVARVGHAQRLEEALGQEVGQRHARHALEQHGQHVVGHVVHPALARVRQQGQLAQARHPGIGRQGVRLEAGIDAGRRDRFLDRPVAGAVHDGPEAHPEGQQVAQGDGAMRGDGIVEGALGRSQHAPVLELGQPLIHMVVEADARLFHQHQRGGREHRLGHRGDAHDRVPPHRRARLEVLDAEVGDVDLVPAADQQDESGDVAPLDVVAHALIQPRQARCRQPTRSSHA
ncbi:hypothetical protein D3C72_1308400 [compost metagenome]